MEIREASNEERYITRIGDLEVGKVYRCTHGPNNGGLFMVVKIAAPKSADVTMARLADGHLKAVGYASAWNFVPVKGAYVVDPGE